MIIDTSNAPCGPGFLPGLRLSEGRFAIHRELTAPAAGAVAARSVRPPAPVRDAAGRLRPPKSRPTSAPVAVSESARQASWRSRPAVRARLPVSTPPRVPLSCPRYGAPGPSRLRVFRLRSRPGGCLSESVSPRFPRDPRPRRRAGGQPRSPPPAPFRLRPQIRRDYPLNLSILLSGGKETNKDSLSSGERRGKSPAPNPRPAGGRGKCGVRKTACPVSVGGLSPSDRGSARGRCEAGNGPRRAGVRSSRSRVVWECSPKRVVNSI